MKSLNLVLLLIVFLSLNACKKTLASFEEPQPAEIKSISKIPKRLQGSYLRLKDSSKIEITEYLITSNTIFDLKIHRNELDSLEVLKGNTIINLKTKKVIKVKIIADSLLYRTSFKDTLLNLRNKDILKKYKGYYFLNQFYEENSWSVEKLKLSKGILSIASIDSIAEIKELEDITAAVEDTLNYKFKPTKKEFKKFIKTEGFGQSESYLKIR